MAVLTIEPRVIFTGSSQVGKTSILRRHLKGSFSPHHVPTLGAEPIPFTPNSPGDGSYWDLGSGRHAGLSEGYYIGAWAFVVVFDVAQAATKDHAISTIQKIRLLAPGRPILLCGNKADVEAERITEDECREIAETLGVPYEEVSAKEDLNIKNVFDWAARHVAEVKNSPEHQERIARRDAVISDDENLEPGYDPE